MGPRTALTSTTARDEAIDEILVYATAGRARPTWLSEEPRVGRSVAPHLLVGARALPAALPVHRPPQGAWRAGPGRASGLVAPAAW